MVDLRS
jgi:hypothetical protein